MAAATGAFGDVDEDAFYAASVDWAYDNGITEGASATTFEPDRALTRGEGVTMLHRFSQGANGGMHFAPIQAVLDAGTSIELLELDGVSLNVQCYEGVWVDPTTGETDEDYPNAVGMGIYVYFTSADDGWYMVNENSDGPLNAGDLADLVDNYVGDEEEAGPEYAYFEYDAGAAITPNGGYIGVDGETNTYILYSSVRDNDCEFYGMLQWAEPPGD
ncbi:MAG: S-layer homology domain-containing protein [Acidimicrobiaceae bacterium]|nr:S-layer homology domain-containing protein [Acidimicrobiaceae bacterium]